MAITYLFYLRYFPKVRDRYHWWCTLDFIWHIRFVLEDIKKQCKNPLIWQFFISFWEANYGSLNRIPSKFGKKLFEVCSNIHHCKVNSHSNICKKYIEFIKLCPFTTAQTNPKCPIKYYRTFFLTLGLLRRTSFLDTVR